MIKEWFVLLQGNRYGPFSIYELKEKVLISPDTLVWKKGFSKWVKAKEVDELKILFKDEDPKGHTSKKNDPNSPERLGEILEVRWQKGPWMFWWIIVTLIVLYVLEKFFF